MPSSSDDESQRNFILAFIFALIFLVIAFVIGIAISRSGSMRAPAQPPSAVAAALATKAASAPRVAEVTETVTVVIPDGASIQVENGTVKFYFATGSADLAPGAAQALAAVIQGVEGGQKAVVSGFHDTTGDAAINDALAKRRAQTVRDVLIGLGVPADKIELQKPEASTGSGSDDQARRVEVTLAR